MLKNTKVIRTFYFIFKLLKDKGKDNHNLFFLEMLIGLLQESKAILNMVFPAIIIQFIVDSSNMDMVILFVFWVSLALTIISIGLEILSRSLSGYSTRGLNYLILKLNEHAMEINFMEFERNKTMEQFDKAWDGLWNSLDVDYYIFKVIISKLLSFGITTYIFVKVHWIIALVVIASLFIEFALSVRLSKRLITKDQQISTLTHKINYISDTIFDCKTNKDIFLYHAKQFFINKYQKITTEKLEIEKEKKTELFNNEKKSAYIEFIRTGFVYTAAVLQNMKGLLPISNFTLFISAAKQMTYAIWQIMQAISALLKSGEYYNDYLQYMKIDEHKDNVQYEHIEKGIQTIEFKNVSFRYPNQEEYTIQNLSFKVLEGETIALVGDNGAGKSTVIKLLLRLYPVTDGDILVNEKSIYAYNLNEYISYFAPVFQDYMLYSFTIGENIMFDKRMAADTLNMLLNNIGLDIKIKSLPNGINTPYTKRFYPDGVEFSGGEEQKLVIGRAFAHEGEVMILDEPSSALDPIAEYSIYEIVHQLRSNHTTFFISHRLSTTCFSDRILVLDNGRLMEQGSHENLISLKGLYYSMYNMQKQYYRNRSANSVID